MGWLRVSAWLIDWVCVVVWAGLLVPVGLLVRRFEVPVWGVDVGSFFVLIVPVTVWLAWWESMRGATPGKWRRGVAVVSVRSGRKVSFGRAVVRNVLKVAVPWELGHTVAFGFASQADPQPWLLGLSLVLYGVLLWWMVSLFVGVSPYDVVAGTRVTWTGAASRLSRSGVVEGPAA
jgi:uncharacterized RDD family membrane protein YckC